MIRRILRYDDNNEESFNKSLSIYENVSQEDTKGFNRKIKIFIDNLEPLVDKLEAITDISKSDKKNLVKKEIFKLRDLYLACVFAACFIMRASLWMII